MLRAPIGSTGVLHHRRRHRTASRFTQAQVERLRQENKILRAEYGRQIIQRLSEIDTVSRRLFEKRTAGMPTVSKRILKASYTVPTFRRKAPLLWERYKYFR
jgi:hypothetical protein